MNSMTGYANTTISLAQHEIDLRMMSENSRYLNIMTTLPHGWEWLEADIKKVLRKHVQRGNVRFSMVVARSQSPADQLRSKITKPFLKAFGTMMQQGGHDYVVRPSDILNIVDHFQGTRVTLSQTSVRQLLKSIDQLATDWQAMRQREGDNLTKAMFQLLEQLTKHIEGLKGLSDNNLDTQLRLMRKKLKRLVGATQFNPSREEIMKEVAFYAAKADISEELDRLGSHTKQFRRACKKHPAGKRLDFLLQEMNRELNTASSKTTLHKASQLVIESRLLVESLREQVQNIE